METPLGRVGLYVQARTRDRLKLYQAKVCIRLGRVLNQSECIDLLLDEAGEPSLEEMQQALAVGGPRQ